jgi:hypothetical protein
MSVQRTSGVESSLGVYNVNLAGVAAMAQPGVQIGGAT